MNEQFSFRPAERKRAKLRLCLSGPSGSGKTYSSLLIASGLAPWNKIAVLDSEHSSAELYANLGNYSVLTLEPPYDPQRYIDAIHAAEQAGFEVLIIDSLSHAWNGEGGILDQQGKATDTKYRGNSFSAWREFTPKNTSLINAILASNLHIIATLRSKTEYSLVDENGKKQVRKLGLAPIAREGTDYEFSVFMEISIDHNAIASKDRTGIFDGKYFKPSRLTGERLLQWLNCDTVVNAAINSDQTPTGGANTSPFVAPTIIPVPPDDGSISDIFRVLNCELVKSNKSAKQFIKLSLLGKSEALTAWSNDATLLDLRPGAKIEAKLSKKNEAWVIDSYIPVAVPALEVAAA